MPFLYEYDMNDLHTIQSAVPPNGSLTLTRIQKCSLFRNCCLRVCRFSLILSCRSAAAAAAVAAAIAAAAAFHFQIKFTENAFRCVATRVRSYLYSHAE